MKDDVLTLDPISRPHPNVSLADPISELVAEFHRSGISYCYWKSSRLAKSVLAGNGDLDLLLAKEDQHRAEAILLEHGFKLFLSGRDHVSVLSFLGHDERLGKLIHVHLHFRLISGERLLRNYRLPWESAVLARAAFHPVLPLRILDPASEAVLLVVRACLELRRNDPLTRRGWSEVTGKFALDRAELAARVDRAAFRERAAELVGPELVDILSDALYGQRALQDHRPARRQIERHLAPYRTYNRCEMRLRSSWRAIFWLAAYFNKRALHLPRLSNRRAPGGGCVIAVLGVDGSGKSTAVATIRKWLGAEIDVVPIYFGTGAGRPSPLLWPFKAAAALVGLVVKTKPKGASHGKISEREPGFVYGVLFCVWAMAVACEKWGKLLAARRGANRGLIIVTDRYPQSEVATFSDGPLLNRLAKAPGWLRRAEAAVYRLARRLGPDLVIKLQVNPRTVALREPDMDSKVAEERVSALARLRFPGSRVVSIDAEQPLSEVTRAIKREIWDFL